ncbi:MAG: T9SS type A sorting domain-containing protein [Bacteroidetes bacterium]|nr:T9SS type A sorting domain-containing protein [Bacteroidota bacterium]
MKSTFLTPLLLCLAAFSAWAQPNAGSVQPISTVRSGSLNTRYTIRALVLNGPELGGIRYLQDATGAMAIFKTSWSPAVQRGDSILVEGRLTTFNQLRQLDQVQNDDYVILNSDNPLPAPQDITFTGFNAAYEARLVRLQHVSFVESGSFAAQNNYNISAGTEETRQVRVTHAASDLNNSPIPQGNLPEIVGIMSRFNAEYQLLPRDLADLGLKGPLFASTPTAGNLSTTGFSVSFTTKNNGNTRIQYGLTEALEMGTLEDNTPKTTHSLPLAGLTPGTLYYVRCFSVDAQDDTSFAGIQVMGTVSNSTGTMRAYFCKDVATEHASSTGNTAVNSTSAGVRDTVVNLINRATGTLDIAIYNFNNAQIVDALNAAKQRGVYVRVVGNGDIMSSNWDALNTDEKYKTPPTRDGIMHNKFIIVDADATDAGKPELLTGSLNYTDENINDYANNIVIIQDQTLARAYTLEFEEMLAGSYGAAKKDNTPKEFLIGGKRVELYMSPTDKVNDIILKEINRADQNLYINTMLCTRPNIGSAIASAHSRLGAGNVWVVIGEESGDVGVSVFNTIRSGLGSQARVWDDGNNSMTYLIHHKYMLVDHGTSSDPFVLTGSHNWSNSANTINDENTLIIHDADLADIYYQEMRARMWNLGMAPATRQSITEHLALRLYPNPAAHTATLELVPRTAQATTLEFLSVAGQVISRRDLGLLHTPQTLTLDLAGLPQGLYLVRVHTAGGTQTLRLAKQ